MSESAAGTNEAAGAAAPRPITEWSARLALRILGDEDVAAVHAAALELLGADGAAAEAAAGSAPDAFTFAGRVREHDVAAGAGRLWLATGGPAARVRPRDGGEPRPSTAIELDAALALADALPEVAIVAGPPVRAAGETALGELAHCFGGTTKHVMPRTLTTAAEAEAAVAMATAVAGSEAARRELPPLSLRGGPEALEPALVFARAGLPVGLVCPPGAPAGASVRVDDASGADPAAVTAALVRNHAGVLAACGAVQAAAPRAPFFYVADPALAGLPAAGPAAAQFQIAAAQLAAHVGLPVVAAGMATTGHEPDWQACTQDAAASLSTTAAGADVTGGAGVLGAGAAFSPEQLVMDAEIFSWNAFIASGIQVDEETIALESIAQVGIGGNYLGQRHTRRHMKQVWRPRLLDRSMWDAWVASGREGAYEKACALVDQLLADHDVVPLGDEVHGMLLRIVAEAGL